MRASNSLHIQPRILKSLGGGRQRELRVFIQPLCFPFFDIILRDEILDFRRDFSLEAPGVKTRYGRETMPPVPNIIPKPINIISNGRNQPYTCNYYPV